MIHTAFQPERTQSRSQCSPWVPRALRALALTTWTDGVCHGHNTTLEQTAIIALFYTPMNSTIASGY